MAVGSMITDEINPLLLAKNQKAQASMDIRLCGLTEELRDRYEERAGIIEFEGGLTRDDAERLAMQEVGRRKVAEHQHAGGVVNERS